MNLLQSKSVFCVNNAKAKLDTECRTCEKLSDHRKTFKSFHQPRMLVVSPQHMMKNDYTVLPSVVVPSSKGPMRRAALLATED
jgi:hypothetical protein